MDTGRTYIVTGCTGYVGNVFAKKLLREGCRVVGYARSREKAARVFAGEKMEFVYGDIADADAFEGCFAGGGRFVVLHTAAKVSIGESSAKDVYDAAVRGTQNVADACVRHGAKLLHISSTEAVPRGVKLREDLSNYIPDPARVRKGYARAKSAADALVLRAVKERGLDASVLLLASVLGPGDTGPGHMSQMMIEFIEGKLPASVRGGYNDFDIRDVADVLPAVVERAQAGESYLFAHKPDSINDVLAVLAEMTGRKVPPALPLWLAYAGAPFLQLAAKLRGERPLYTAAALHALHADADFPIGKAQKAFGYAPRPLQETVRDHARYLAEQGWVKL